LTPDLFSLLQTPKVIKRIDIESFTLTQAAIEKIVTLSKSAAAEAPHGPPQVRVEGLRFSNVLVAMDKARFGPLAADVAIDSLGNPENATISTPDGKLSAVMKHDQSSYVFDVSAKAWTSPVGPPLVFDELILHGTATATEVNMAQVSAKLYGGTASGTGALSWAKGFKLNGKFAVDHVELESVVAMLSPGLHVGGSLSTKPVLSASAQSAGRLLNSMFLEAPFSVQNGLIHGIDIQKAATSLVKQGSSGGQTRFDQLSGHLVMDHGAYRFTQIRIASGALAADGNLNVSAKRELSGRINAQVNVVAASANVPLNVAGTIGSPLLYPTGGTVAGAAVGTAMLGPGVGTSVGAKFGGWAEGLFDKKDEKRAKP
jgi:hypothetical protein